MRLRARALPLDTPLDARDLDLWEGALGILLPHDARALSLASLLQLLTLALSSSQGGGRREAVAGWWVAASDTDEINQDIDDSTLIFLPAHVVVFFPSSPILKRPATSTFQDVQYV